MDTNGINTTLQIGKESSWGTKAVGTQNLNFNKESFTMEPELLEEDTVIGSISAVAQDLVAYNTKGGFETILKPDDAVALFSLAFGVQATPVLHTGAAVAYDHVITPVDAETDLPSFTAIVNRKLEVIAYTGSVMSNLEISAKAKDYVRTKITTINKKEETATLATLTNPTKKAYTFANGSVKIDSTVFADILSVTFTANNNATEGDQTLGSGLYKSQGGHGLREYTVSLEAKYNAQAESIISTKYKPGVPVSVDLQFLSPNIIETGINHSFDISMPVVMLTGGLPNVSGKDAMKVTLAGKALQTGAGAPCTVTIVSDIAVVF